MSLDLSADEQWNAALTKMEDELDRHEEQVRLDEVRIVPTWEPPADLPPLPNSCAKRARHLQSRISLLSTFVQFQLRATQSDLEHLHQQENKGQRGTHNKAIALFLDASV